MRDPLEGCFSHQPPLPAVLPATYEEAADGTSTAIVHGSRYHHVPVVGGALPVDGDQGAIGLTQRHTQRGPVWMGSAKGQTRTRSRGAAESDLWSRVTGNHRHSFQSLASRGAFAAIATTPEIISTDHGGNYGAGSVLVVFPAGGRMMLAALTGTTTGTGQLVYAFDLNDPAFAWSSDPHDGLTRIPSRTVSPFTFTFTHAHGGPPWAMQYVESNGTLLVGCTTAFGFATRTRAVLLATVPTTVEGDEIPAGGILLDAILWGDLPAGSGVCDGLVIRYQRTYVYDGALRRTNAASGGIVYVTPPDVRSVESGNIVAYDPADSLAIEWQFDLYSLFTSYAHPLIYKTGTSSKGYCMPIGLSPAYAKKARLIYLAAACRDGIPQCTDAGTYPAAFDAANTIPENYTAGVLCDNQHARLSGVSDPDAHVSPDAYVIRASIVAWDQQTGDLKHRYDLPELDARDASNYLVDTSSFSVNLSPAFLLRPEFQIFGTKSQSGIGMLAEHEIDTSAGVNPTAGDPTWDGLGFISGGVRGIFDTEDPDSYINLSTISSVFRGRLPTVGGQQYLFPHYRFWPAHAGYRFDLCPFIDRLGTSIIPTWNNTSTVTPESPMIVVDDKECIYLHYLRPINVITGRSQKTGNQNSGYNVSSCQLPTGVTEPEPGVYEPVGGSVTLEWFAIPRLLTMWKSFLVSLDSKLNHRWTHETTTYLTDTENGSGLSLPHGSHIFRMIPTRTGVYVLRTVRVTFSSMPIVWNTARFANMTKAQVEAVTFAEAYNTRIGEHEPLVWAKLVLEFRNRFSGVVEWTRTLWDPSAEGITTPTCVPGAFMVADSDGGVLGRFDHCTATYGASGGGFNYGEYILSQNVGTMFRCDRFGNLTTREATLLDPQVAGTNLAVDNKARVNAAHAAVDGSLLYNVYSPPPDGLSKWVIARLG